MALRWRYLGDGGRLISLWGVFGQRDKTNEEQNDLLALSCVYNQHTFAGSFRRN